MFSDQFQIDFFDNRTFDSHFVVMWSWNSCLQQTCFLVYTVHGNQTVKTTYAATATMWFLSSIPFFRSISDPCSWLVTIDCRSICFCSQGASCGAGTAWWDCFCLCFGHIYKECMITVVSFHIIFFLLNLATISCFFSKTLLLCISSQIWCPKANSGDRTGVTKTVFIWPKGKL